MNATTTLVELTEDAESENVVSFCGKGFHYDWRAIVAALEAADLDAELAHLETASTRS